MSVYPSWSGVFFPIPFYKKYLFKIINITLKRHVRKEKKMRRIRTTFPGFSNGSRLWINGSMNCNNTCHTPLCCTNPHISIPKHWLMVTPISESCSYISSCFILLHTAEEKREYFKQFLLPFAEVSILKRYYSLTQKHGCFSAVFIKSDHWSQQSLIMAIDIPQHSR